jgi:hypothetical protein
MAFDYKTIRTNSAFTIGILYEDLGDIVRRRNRQTNLELSIPEQRYCAALRRDGYVVVKNYWPRERALHTRDRLSAYLLEGRSRDFECGAYLRCWDNRNGDQGVRRIYHVDRLINDLAEFRNDSFVGRVAAAYYGFPFTSGVLVYQHNAQSNANTRYFHVDSFTKEFKAFLYLDDVDETNGPFTYLRGTHRSHSIRLKKSLIGNRAAKGTSFYQRDLKAVLKNEVKICGEAGTLILADVRGFHRGSPQVSRSRSALVNYLVKLPGDLYPEKDISSVQRGVPCGSPPKG